MNYTYWAFGLQIESEIIFPELVEEIFDEPDLVITLGKVPTQLRFPATIQEEMAAINDTEYLWEVKNVAKYYAANGKEIIIEPFEGIDDRSVRLFLLATVMAAVLHQRNSIPLHASSIKLNNELVLITGDSGAGKSTTLSGLMKRGYTIFSDDVIVVKEYDNQKVLATSSYPMIKLWDDAIVKLDNELFEDRSFLVKPGLDKYGIFFHEQFDKETYSIGKIFILKTKDSGAIEAKELVGGEAFKGFNLQSYRPYLLHSNQLRQLNYTILMTIVNNAKIIEVVRPKICNPEELVSAIDALL